jgi:ribosomal protein S18 acetylase RimI-like enzyme
MPGSPVIVFRKPRRAVTVRLANLLAKHDADGIVRLLDEYAADPMGRGRPLDDAVKEHLIDDLANQPSALVYLAELQCNTVGLAVCFLQYSTFGGCTLLNIHDFFVTAAARRQGTGRLLLQAISRDARGRGVQKVTLEVRADNIAAQSLYKAAAFGECQPPMLFWQNTLISQC